MVIQAAALKQDRDEMFADFYKLVNGCCTCGDYDPFHLLLREVEKDMEDEMALWFSSLFIAHYNPGSAYIAFHNSNYLDYREWDLPIETARRALYGGRIYDHLEDLCTKAKAAGGIRKLYERGFTDDPHENWHTVRQNVGSLYGAGRWAEYTFSEILQKVHGFNVCPTDMGNNGSSGPRNGLILLMGAGSDHAGEVLFNHAKNHVEVPWFDYAVLESLACDFNSLNKGKYYIGRDIDRQQGRLMRVEERGYDVTPVYEARAEVFQRRYLGEYGGWRGIDKDRLKHYINTGEVIDR